ncbi:MAG TPA: molybdate ABC transporter substrate-binding protein [Pilimelia sp.]|nr:molybdate ABC transporter substrate-binding protein [Pilimelia sp.]
MSPSPAPRTLALLVLLTAGALLPACGTGDDPAGGATPAPGDRYAGRVTVSAASSLTETFTALGAEFERANPGVDVVFNFGASSTLAQQIVAGAPPDVFAAASPATMKVVVDAGAAVGEPRVFARNRLVIVVPRDNPAKVTGIADLARPGVKVALCAAQVPCGAAAAKALAAAGVRVTPVTLEQDVKATLTKVRLGEVDAGLVYRTDARAAAAEVTGIDFAEAAEAVNDYPVVAVREGANAAAGAAFIALVTSPRGRAVLTAAGFEVP